MNQLKRQVQIMIAISVVTMLLAVSISNVIAFSGSHSACSTSSCHDDPSGITITLSNSSFIVSSEAAFNLNLQTNGVSGQNEMTVKFPSSVVNNSQFSYGVLGDEGQVNDNDPADTDSDVDQIVVIMLLRKR